MTMTKVMMKMMMMIMMMVISRLTQETLKSLDTYLECEWKKLILEFSFVALGSFRHHQSRSTLQVQLKHKRRKRSTSQKTT